MWNDAVEVGIVDEPFPPDDGARLLEIHAHDDADAVGTASASGSQPVRVVERGGRIVDRARANDHGRRESRPSRMRFDRLPCSRDDSRRGVA